MVQASSTRNAREVWKTSPSLMMFLYRCGRFWFSHVHVQSVSVKLCPEAGCSWPNAMGCTSSTAMLTESAFFKDSKAKFGGCRKDGQFAYEEDMLSTKPSSSKSSLTSGTSMHPLQQEATATTEQVDALSSWCLEKTRVAVPAGMIVHHAPDRKLHEKHLNKLDSSSAQL